MREIVKTFFTMNLVCILLFACLAGCGTPNTNDFPEEEDGMKIESIYISRTSGMQTGPSYKIDLKNGKVWVYMVHPNYKYRMRNESAANEGYYFVKDLESKKIDYFLEECKEYGFEEWENYYAPENGAPMDGLHWFIDIIYSDGTKKEIHGNEAYPETWNEMNDAFEHLTGYHLLEGLAPQPTFWFFGRPVYWGGD